MGRIDEQLYEWIKKQLDKGINPDVIRAALKEQGYNPDLVDNYISEKGLSKPNPKEEIKVSELATPKLKLNPIFLLVGTIVIILLGGALLYLVWPGAKTQEYPTATVPMLSGVDTSKLIIISDNPDLIFEAINWSADYIFKRNNFSFAVGPNMGEGAISSPSEIWYPWYGSGFYYADSLPRGSNRKGIIIVHPQDQAAPKPRYWSQNISLPNKSLVLVASIADVADYIDPCSKACSDAIIKIKIFDHTTNLEDMIYKDVVNLQWKDVFLNISKYGGKNVTFKIEGWNGGPCAEWCGEWAAIDKFYIAAS